jgi:hypothetical protein
MQFWTDHTAPPIQVPDEDVAGAFFESIYAAPPYDEWPLRQALAEFLRAYYDGAAWDVADFKRIEWIITQVERQAARVFGRVNLHQRLPASDRLVSRPGAEYSKRELFSSF